jgi:predicted aspartyl protease
VQLLPNPLLPAPLRGATPLMLLCVACAATEGTRPAAVPPPPELAAGAAEPPPDAVVAELPFLDHPEPNRIVLNLAEEGRRPLRVMLDIGASHSVMTPLAARALGVTVRRIKSSPYRRSTLLGRDLLFYVDTSSSDTGSRTGSEYALLGANFLSHYVVEIDGPARVVRFLDPERYAVPEVAGEGAAVLPIRLRSNVPMVELRLGEHALGVFLDTGWPAGLTVMPGAARRLGIDVDALPRLGEFGTALGPMEVRLHEAEDLRLGPFAFGRTPVLVAPRGWYNLVGSKNAVAGMDLLRQFRLRIDYPRRRLWLERGSDARPTYLGTDYELTRRAGAFLWESGGRFRVVGVLPGSPAERFGLRPGDWVVEPLGDEPLRLEEVVEAVVAGRELTAAREQDGIWVDLVMPASPAIGEDGEGGG